MKRTLLQTSNPGTLQRRMLSKDHFWLHFCDLNSRWCWPLGPFHHPFCTAHPITFALPTNVSAMTTKPRVLLPWSPKFPGTLPRNILPLKTLEPYVVNAWEEGKWCIIYIQAWITGVNPTEFLMSRRLLWAELHPTKNVYVEVLTHSTLKCDHIWR